MTATTMVVTATKPSAVIQRRKHNAGKIEMYEGMLKFAMLKLLHVCGIKTDTRLSFRYLYGLAISECRAFGLSEVTQAQLDDAVDMLQVWHRSHGLAEDLDEEEDYISFIQNTAEAVWEETVEIYAQYKEEEL